MLMMRPHRRFIMPRDAARIATNAPRRLASSTASQSSSLMRNRMLSRVRPALFTRMSIAPKSFSTLSTSAVDGRRIADVAGEAARLRRDRAAAVLARDPRRVRRRRRARRHSASDSAIARPMPRVLPVTRAVRPTRSIFTRRRARGVAATSAAVPHVAVFSDGAIFFTSPTSTLPGPISTNRAFGNRCARSPASRRSSGPGFDSCSSKQLLRARQPS